MANNRLRVGTYNATQMTSTYDIDDWTVQSDQRNAPWRIVSPSENFREFDAVTEPGLDGTRRMIGGWNGAWYFPAITPLMFDYVRNTYFPTDGVNETMTIVTKTVYGWKCFNIEAHLNLFADVGESRPRGNLMKATRLIDFTDGALNTGGGFKADAFTSGFDIGGIPT